MKQRVIITAGEPAGIGPNILVQLAQYNWPVELVACANASLLLERSKLLGLPLKLLPYISTKTPVPQIAGTLTLISVPLYSSVIPGKLQVENSYYVIDTLSIACEKCLKGEFLALITGPVHKGIINKAMIPFSGHTEFFEKYSNSSKAVMMLINDNMRIALATNHIPIKEISNFIKSDLLIKVIDILNHDLHDKFNIYKPHIMVCGLNPHAGEGGYIGTEEIDIIIPVLKNMRLKGFNISGPLPADTIFQPKYINNSDVILVMYHDQGLPVLKYRGFNNSVNVTLGLPFIRTSVDHGTALDLANKGTININSFIKAINTAIKMANNFYAK